MVLGSVSEYCAAHAHCPVLVHRTASRDAVPAAAQDPARRVAPASRARRCSSRPACSSRRPGPPDVVVPAVPAAAGPTARPASPRPMIAARPGRSHPRGTAPGVPPAARTRARCAPARRSRRSRGPGCSADRRGGRRSRHETSTQSGANASTASRASRSSARRHHVTGGARRQRQVERESRRAPDPPTSPGARCRDTAGCWWVETYSTSGSSQKIAWVPLPWCTSQSTIEHALATGGA